MKKLLLVVLTTVIAVGLALFNLNQHPNKSEPAVVPSSPAANTQVEERTYDKGADTVIYSSPTPESMSIDDKIQNGTKLYILGQQNGFYHVRYNVQGDVKEGFIPNWYLDDDKASIIGGDYGYQVLKEETKGLLYPGGPKIIELEKARLLKPFAESGDWVEVKILVYDIPAIHAAWIKKDSLVSTSEMQAKEGFIPSDAELYFVSEYKDIKNSKPQKEDYPKGIFIVKREGGYAYVGAAGGWDAWVEEKWIRYTENGLK